MTVTSTTGTSTTGRTELAIRTEDLRKTYTSKGGDVPAVRGVYKGHAGQNLSVNVLVRPALDDEGAELLQETAAAPPPKTDHEIEQQQQQ